MARRQHPQFITARMMDLFLVSLGLVGTFLVGLFTQRYLPSYMTEKGKNLATKEDVADITKRIEDVKSGYAHELEGVRAAISSRLGIHQFRYQREYELLIVLSERIVALRDATIMLRPITEYVDPDEPEPERKRRKLKQYGEAARNLYEFSETRQPFLPQTVIDALRQLSQLAWHEVVQYKHRSPSGQNFDPKYWENAEENAEKIKAVSDMTLQAIRDRVRLWERFEPGP